MKFLWSLVALFTVLAVAQNATQQERLQEALQIVMTMPECARTCLLQAVAASGKAAADIDISDSCNNATATADISACAASACTPKEQLTAKNITEVLCDRPVHDAPRYSAASVAGFTLAGIAFFMRMASKIRFPCDRASRVDTDFWWDDYVIIFVFILLIPITVFSNLLAELGMGRDVWTIPFDNFTQMLKLYFIDEILYLTALPGVKIAILCTYLRIFTLKSFRVWVYVGIGLNVAYWITFFFATLLQCQPISMAWTRWDGEHPGRCNNINAQSWASAGINIALDLVVVGLPMPMLWSMNLNIRKKLLVMLMFGVGFFVTVVSIIRLQMIVKFGDSQNLTRDYKQAGQWTVIEIDVAVVCACMPGMRNLIRRAFPKLMGVTAGGRSTGAVTPGLSGRTAVGSGLDKSGHEVYIRPRQSDDGDFIPLDDVSSQNVPVTQVEAGKPQDRKHSNFSRPYSAAPTDWSLNTVDLDRDGDEGRRRAVSPV